MTTQGNKFANLGRSDREIQDLIAQARRDRAEYVAAMFGKMVRAIKNRSRVKRVERELYAMSDTLLKDIGISRGDIPAGARGMVRRDAVTPGKITSADVVAFTKSSKPEGHRGGDLPVAA